MGVTRSKAALGVVALLALPSPVAAEAHSARLVIAPVEPVTLHVPIRLPLAMRATPAEPRRWQLRYDVSENLGLVIGKVRPKEPGAKMGAIGVGVRVKW